MTVTVGINGFGRIGRCTLAHIAESNRNDVQVVAINATGPVETNAHLLRYDSVHGRFPGVVKVTEDGLDLGRGPIRMMSTYNPEELDWQGVDVVLECTGKFLTLETIQGHLDRGAKRVIVAAPVKVGDVLNIVVGVNHQLYDPAKNRIVTAASCTTNCLAPVVKVVHEQLGIRHGQITTIHNPTNTNVVVDAPHKDLRRARSAMESLAPTSTGSATAIALIYPELKGKLNGHAVRAPVLNASLTDCVFELQRETTAEEVNALFQHAASSYLSGILGYEELPLVSADYARDTRSSIVDALSTMVTDGTLLKVYAWYDNEMGYACRMVDLACHMRDVGV